MLPFLGSEALAVGTVNRYQLVTSYDAVFRDVFVPKGHVLAAADKAIAAWLWSRRQATVAGLSAAALHGSLWLDANLPAELNHRHRHKTRGIVLHSDRLADDELCMVRGIPVTTPARTAYDLGRCRRDRDGCHQARCAHAGDASQGCRYLSTRRASSRHTRNQTTTRGDHPVRCRRRVAAGDTHSTGLDRGGTAPEAHADRGVRSVRRIRQAHRHGLG